MKKLYPLVLVISASLFLPMTIVANEEEYCCGTEVCYDENEDYDEQEDAEECNCNACPYYDEDEDVEEDWYDTDSWPGRREDSWFRDLER